jgi:outer membrane protein assembly factor BamB
MKRLAWVTFVTLVAGTARADDWPQWLGPKRDGVWREGGIVEKFPPGGPPVVWRVPVGGGYAGPSVAGGRVYVADYLTGEGVKLPESGFDRGRGTGRERVLCLDEKTGKELWSDGYEVAYTISYAAGPRCSPTVDAGRAYFLGAMGDLRAYDAASGKPLWSKNFPKDYSATVPVWGFAAHPLIDGDKLICLAGGSDDRLVIAFDKATGKELWAAESCPGDFGYCPPMVYEFGGRRQLVIWHTRAVVGLDPETGKRLWRVPFEVKAALTAPTPRKVGADGLFVTSFYNGSLFLKVGADAAEVVWKSKARGEYPEQTTDLSSIMPTPVIDGDHAYGVCSYGQLRCIEVTTGRRVWETMQATRGKRTPEKVAAEPTPAQSERWSNAFLTPLADGRTVIFNEQGDLILARLTPAGYEEVDRATVIEPTNPMAGGGRKVVWVHPAYANGRVYVRNDKELVCLDVAK